MTARNGIVNFQNKKFGRIDSSILTFRFEK